MHKERKLSGIAKSLLGRIFLPAVITASAAGCYTTFYTNPSPESKNESIQNSAQNRPYLDSDGDGIYDIYDPYPFIYGPYVDTNGDGRIDAGDVYVGLGIDNYCLYGPGINRDYFGIYPPLGFISYFNYTMYYGGYFLRIYYPTPIDVRSHEKVREIPARPRGEAPHVGQRDEVNITRTRVPEIVKSNMIIPYASSTRMSALPQTKAGTTPQIRVREFPQARIKVAPSPAIRSNPQAPRARHR